MLSETPTPAPPAVAGRLSPSRLTTSPQDGQVIAAVDLGSNSFHMVVARLEHGRLSLIDRIREMVRLGAGLDNKGQLSEDAIQRALDCLGRFRERLRNLHADSVRAVGTNTLRKTRDRDSFLGRAEGALGHPIDVISGMEEARLVYLGAAHDLPAESEPRLVVDIGGGSTELIAGRGFTAERLESLYMGCVSLSTICFPKATVKPARFEAARMNARLELEPVSWRFRGGGWRRAFGTSGTIRATARMLTREDNPSGIISRDGLSELEASILGCGDMTRHRPPGLGEQRAPVYPGGLAILIEVFDALGIESMMAVDSALREGLLYDMLGRMTDEDVRERSVRSLQERFHVDDGHAARVASVALDFHSKVLSQWELGGDLARLLLGWAARLHEIGLDIAHAKHHWHAAYLLRNADLAGFSAGEQLLLSTLVANHRRKFRPELVEALPSQWRVRALRLTVILRLAVVMCRSRSRNSLPDIALKAGNAGLTMTFPTGWLERHPLTLADLRQEMERLSPAGIRLRVK